MRAMRRIYFNYNVDDLPLKKIKFYPIVDLITEKHRIPTLMQRKKLFHRYVFLNAVTSKWQDVEIGEKNCRKLSDNIIFQLHY